MATKKKTTTKKTAAKKAPVKAAPARQKTVRECINESDVLRFHVTITTILSLVVCALVAALLITLTD